MLRIGQGYLLAAFQVEELGPGFDVDKAVGLSGDVFYGDVFILLRRIGPHFEPKYPHGFVDVAIPHHDIFVVNGLAAAGKGRVAKAKFAILDQDIHVFAVVGVGVGPGAFAAFQRDGVVVDRHVAAFDQDIGARIQVDGVGAGCLDGRVGRGNVQVEDLDVGTLVVMAGPETRVVQLHVLYLHVVAVPDEHQARARHFEVGTLRIFLAPLPERLPVFQPVAVEGTFARNREAIDPVGVDQRRKVVEALPLHARGPAGVVRDIIGAFQCGPFTYVQMRLGLEEQRAAHEGTLRNNDHAATLPRRLVDGTLDNLRLHEGTVPLGPEVGDDVLLAQIAQFHFGIVQKPGGHRGTIRENVFLVLLGLGGGGGEEC